MLSIFYLLALVVNLAAAAPGVHLTELSTINADKSLAARQVVAEGTSAYCCMNCGARYDYGTFWHAFDDFCNWAGNGLELWTSQIYYTGSYYCPGGPICIHIEVQFLCSSSNGEGEAASVSYGGCMGLLDYAIDPPGVCDGPPYPGAHVVSADHCWIFQATADTYSGSMSNTELLQVECDESGRFCTHHGSNQTVDTYNGPEHQFSSASRW